jgi:hypothetical protein
MDIIEKYLRISFIKKSFATYLSSDNTSGIVCSISREYPKGSSKGYWFAFHPHQKDFLEKFSSSYIAFGCGSENKILLIPFNEFKIYLDKFNITERENKRFYWHIHISDENNNWTLYLKKDFDNINLSKYKI